MINHFESSWMNEEVAILEDTAKKFFPGQSHYKTPKIQK